MKMNAYVGLCKLFVQKKKHLLTCLPIVYVLCATFHAANKRINQCCLHTKIFGWRMEG